MNGRMAVVNAPVWAPLVEVAGWGDVFDMRGPALGPPGPAVVDRRHHRLRMDVNLPFGIAFHEDLSCMPFNGMNCRVDYRCG